MMRSIFAAVFALASIVLAANSSHAMWGNGTTLNPDAGGNFGFNAAINGQTRGGGGQRLGHYPGSPYFRSAGPQWIIRGVSFKFDSAELTPSSMYSLDRVAATLRSHRGPLLEVGGHASEEGTPQYNLDLSLRRAKTVRIYLVRHGVNARGLTYRGYGETRPLVTNATEAGRQFNRRVELVPVFGPR